ncbi:MAG: right-handed parallel beta-helix repeat-containing protein, partial [Actinomycetota bacterium]|nr:right-handed parallel beta-helix repeat-containing protein [Actinomycetota bacterium]
MLTDYTGNPGNAQSRINLLTPGDTLTLAAGTYSSLTVSVSGTANNPIMIRGAGLNNLNLCQPSTIVNGTLTITGSYLNMGYFLVTTGTGGGTGGVRINGSQHVILDLTTVRDVSGPCYEVKNNARYIYLMNCEAGRYSLTAPQERASCGFLIGTPSGSWPGGVPDRTGYVHIVRAFSQSVQGNNMHFYEGTHHIKVMYSSTHHDDVSSAPGAVVPKYIGYYSRASDSQFILCSFFDEPLNGFRILETTINGEVFGAHQDLVVPRMRSAGFADDPTKGLIASNSMNIRVFRPLVYGPAIDLVELDGVHWILDDVTILYSLAGWDETQWSSPAALWSTNYPEGKNEFGLFKHWWANLRGVSVGANVYLNEEYVPKADYSWGTGTEFFHKEEEHSIRVARIGYWQGWHNVLATQAAIFNVETQEMISPLIPLRAPIQNHNGWIHTELPYDPPIILDPHVHYRVVVYTPKGAVPPNYSPYLQDWLGTFPGLFFGIQGIGGLGFENRIVRVPSNGDSWVTRVFGRVKPFTGLPPDWQTDTQTQVWSRVFPGEIPDMHVEQPPYKPIIDANGNEDSVDWAAYVPPPLILDSFAVTFGGNSIQAENMLVDCIVGYWREPEASTVDPESSGGMQGAIDRLIPGDVLTVSGVHLIGEQLRFKVSGTQDRPITIKGDGTAILRGSFGTDTVYDCIRITGQHLKFENIVIEQFGRGLVMEGCSHVKVKTVTCRQIYGTGFSVQDGSTYVYLDGCIAHDTGSDLNTGNGFRVGTSPNRWPRDPDPEPTNQIRFDNCQAYRCKGNGFDANAGASLVVFKGCTVNHSLGNAPTSLIPAGTSGFYSRGDRIQFVNCTVTGAPTAGFRPWDVLWDGKVYG